MKITKDIKNIFNQTKLIGLLTVLIVLWLIFYFIPEIFATLFTSFLGNLILLVTTILAMSYNRIYGLALGLIFIVIYRSIYLSKKEGFAWSDSSVQDFLKIQSTINKNVIFDVNLIQQTQASQEEVDYFNMNGEWPWTPPTTLLFEEAVNKNPFIRNYSQDAINNAKKIYNEEAILRVLSTQTKEGQFLLNGVQVQDPSGNPNEDMPSGFGAFGYNSGLITNLSNDVIKCNSSSNNSSLERITYTGKGGILGEQTEKVTPVDYNNLEDIIPGFKFINGPCNPCGALNERPNYTCAYELNVQNKPQGISNVWKYLWIENST
jgi:hypothetical protein